MSWVEEEFHVEAEDDFDSIFIEEYFDSKHVQESHLQSNIISESPMEGDDTKPPTEVNVGEIGQVPQIVKQEETGGSEDKT